MTEKGGIFTKNNWHKSILVDCVFINSMLRIPQIINYAEQFKVPPLNTPSWFIYPCIAYWFHGISEDFYQFKSNFLS
jgi:hypothetical protein